MGKLAFGLPSYYQAIFEKIDYNALNPILETLKNEGIDKETSLLFIENCILFLSTNKRVLFSSTKYHEVIKFWNNTFYHIEKLSSVKNLSRSDWNEIKNIFINIKHKKLGKLQFHEIKEIINIEVSVAEQRMTKQPVLYPPIESCMLYSGDYRYYFENFVDKDLQFKL